MLARLEAEGVLENTVVAFMTDHGISHARGKQFLYDEGTHVPLVIRGPGVERGKVREDLVEHIDLAALSLAVAGIEKPSAMQADNVLDKAYEPKSAIFAARDRCDETVDRIRSVRTDRFLYIRNFYPQRPHLQPNAYKDAKGIVQTLRELNDRGVLSLIPKKLLFSSTRPAEELYEYTTDRYQTINLAENAAYKAELEAHRKLLDDWFVSTKDGGPESEAMYDSDMVEYLKKPNPIVSTNIATMKQWAREGK